MQALPSRRYWFGPVALNERTVNVARPRYWASHCATGKRVNNFHPSTTALAIRTGHSGRRRRERAGSEKWTGEVDFKGSFVNPPRDFCQAEVTDDTTAECDAQVNARVMREETLRARARVRLCR